MIAVFLVIVGIVTAFSYLATPKFESTARIVLKSRHEDMGVFSSNTGGGPAFFPVTKEDINTAIEILLSREVCTKTVDNLNLHTWEPPEEPMSALEEFFDQVLRKISEAMVALDLKTPLKPYDQAIKTLSETLQAEPSPLANAINVSLRGEYRGMVRKVLDTHLDAFLSHYISVYQIEEGEEFFKGERDAFEAKLVASEDLCADFLKEHGITDIGSELTGNNDLKRSLLTQKATVELRIRELEQTILGIENALAQNRILLNREMRQVPSIRDLAERLVTQESERDEMLTIRKPGTEVVKTLEMEIKATESQLHVEVEKLLDADKADLAVQVAQSAGIAEDVEEIDKRNLELKDLQKEHERLLRDQAAASEGFRLYSDKYEEARINVQRNLKRISNVSIADRASKCIEPVFPDKLLMIILSIILGVFCSIGSAFLMDFLDNSLVKPEDVKRILDLDVLTSFPKVRN